MIDKEGWTSIRALRGLYDLLDTTRSAFGEIVTENLRIQSGWTFPYNLDPVFINLIQENGATVTHSGSFAVLQSGTNPAGLAEIITKRAIVYTPGTGATAKFTAVFDTPVENCKQLIGIGNTTDGWYFGYNGLKFGIVRINNTVEEWTYQDEWSIDTKKDLIPQKGNVYQIDFQWLGFGAQYFSMEDADGDISKVHKICYSNKHTDVSVQNPSLPITAKVLNEGNTTNVTLKTPSAIGGSYGEIDSSAFTFPIGFDQREKEITLNVETYLFSIRNGLTYEGKVNRLFTVPELVGFASDGNKSVIIRIYFDAVVTDPVWVDFATGISPLQYDESGTGFTGGLKVVSIPLSKIQDKTIDVSNLRGLLSPGSQITVTGLSAGNSFITSGLTIRSRV